MEVGAEPFSLINGQIARMNTPVLLWPLSSLHHKDGVGAGRKTKWHLLPHLVIIASAPTQKPPHQEGTRNKSRLHLVKIYISPERSIQWDSMPHFTLTRGTECQGYFKVYINSILAVVKMSDLKIKPKWIKVLGQVLTKKRLTNIPGLLSPILDPQTSHCISLILGIWGGGRKEVLV